MVAGASSANFDLKQIPKSRSVSGKDEDWSDWTFSFRSYASLMGLGPAMKSCESLTAPPAIVDMTIDAENQAGLLYHILVQLSEGKARNLCKAAETDNGFHVWWLWIREYESTIPGRHQGMLMALLRL